MSLSALLSGGDSRVSSGGWLSATRRGVIPNLDGVRALAVLIVLLSHLGLERIIPGNFGVSLFFVLSGFLITTLMRQEYAGSGTIDFRLFYLRRFLRLGPPLLVALLLALGLHLAGVFTDPLDLAGIGSVLLYYGNYYILGAGSDHLPSGMSVVWSLSVEEHFYFLYPPMALWLMRRGSRRWIAAFFGAIFVAMLLRRIQLFGLLSDPDPYIKMASDTRLDAILYGALLGMLRNPWLDPVPAPRLRLELAATALCLAVLLFSFVYRDPLFRQTWRYTLQYTAMLPLFYLLVARADHPLFRWLRWRPLAWLGTVSYSVYLFNQIVVYAVEHLIDSPLLGALATVAITLALAEIMRRGLEVPLAGLRRRLHRQTAPDAPAAPMPVATPPVLGQT